MNTVNKLIVSGCSFTEPQAHSWAEHTARALDLSLINCALGSMGNDLISRRLLRNLDLALDSGSVPVVCVMWSSWTRSSSLLPTGTSYNSGVTKNPVELQLDTPAQWQIHNQHWTNQASRRIYQAFSQEHLQYVSLEFMVRTQQRLAQLGVPCLFMSYSQTALPSQPLTQDQQWLFDQIDWSQWHTEPMSEWCLANPDPHPGPNWDGFHPTRNQQRQWAEQVVIPRVQSLIVAS